MTHLRGLVVSLLCLAAAVCMRSWGGHLPWQLWMPTGFLLAAAVLAHHQHVGSQLLARAVLWSNLLLGAVVAYAGNSREEPIASVLAVVTGLALLVLGRRGIDGDARGGGFVPVAFRATLVAILVMALADAQTLLLFGTLFFTEGGSASSTGAVSLALAAALILSIAGLYRLRVWGLLLDVVACGALVAASLLGALDLGPVFTLAFAISGGLQIVLAVPLLAALFFPRARKQPSALSRRGVWLGSAAVVAVMVVAILPMFAR